LQPLEALLRENHVPPFSGTWTPAGLLAVIICSIGLKISSVTFSPFPAISLGKRRPVNYELKTIGKHKGHFNGF
jgi:hypothetical protein